MIKCWDDALIGRKLGFKGNMVCPADYGNVKGHGNSSPESTLLFSIEVVHISLAEKEKELKVKAESKKAAAEAEKVAEELAVAKKAEEEKLA